MTEETLPTELELLKQRASDLGIQFSQNIGVDTLRERIEAKLAPVEPLELEVGESNAALTRNQKRMKKMKEAKRLIRVRIMNMNPSKKDWKGEVFTVANNVVGTVRRFVPYDVEWHCEEFILKQIKSRKMSRFYTVKNDKGNKVRKYRLVPEFSVEELPALTKAELKDLADDQLKRGVFTDNQE